MCTKHILVIRLSAMGDVAMTVPVIRSLIQQHPTVKITVLTRKEFIPLFNSINDINFFLIDVYNQHKGLLGLYRLSKELKLLDIDAVADFHNVLRTNILKQFFFNIPYIQINKGRRAKNALISGRVFKQLKTTHSRYADVFKTLGYKIDLLNPIFPERQTLNANLLEIIKPDRNYWIGIAPFAAHKGKQYPINLMQEVIKTLSKNYKIILFGGGAKEAAILETFQKKFDTVINIAHKLLLDDELKIISNLDVMLSMDSANAHLAAMYGVKVVTLWGITHPYAGFGAFNQPYSRMLLSDRNQFPLIPTSIYGKHCPAGYENAMQTITPDNIINKIEAVLLEKNQ